MIQRVLSELFPDYYYGHMPPSAQTEQRRGIPCAGCTTAIGLDERYDLLGLDAYHPTCRAAASKLKSALPDRVPQRSPRTTIAFIQGRGAPYRTWSSGIVRASGGRRSREWLEPGCFGSLKPGSVPLRLNHSQDDVPSSLTFVESSAGLDFVGRIFDSGASRELVRLGNTVLVGVSPKYRPLATDAMPSMSPDVDRNKVTAATLIELSLVLLPQRPAFGAETWVTITAVQ